MNRWCEYPACGSMARPGRHTCTTHRARAHRAALPAEPAPAVDMDEVAYVVAEHLSAADLPRPEQRAVVVELAGRQVPAQRIAELVGVSERTVHRWRAAA